MPHPIAQTHRLQRCLGPSAALAGADALLVDKTGTLTEGRPQVTDIRVLEGDEARLLALAGANARGLYHYTSAGSTSWHGFAQAVLDLGAAAGDGRLILKGTVKTYRYIDEEEAAEIAAAQAGAP